MKAGEGAPTVPQLAPVAPRTATTSQTVAVVGMGIVVPGANSPQEFWRVLNQDQNTFTTPEHFSIDNWFSPDLRAEDKTYIRTAGFIRGFTPHPRLATELDAGHFPGCDRSMLLLRHCLYQALEGVVRKDDDRQGCYIGAGCTGAALEESVLLATATEVGAGRKDAARLRGILAEHYANAVAYPRDALPDRLVRMSCTGLLPSDSEFLAVDSACSSSLFAIDLAVKSLLADDLDLVVCGGTNSGSRRDLVLFAKARGLASNGEIRAFDADADGVLFSDGAAVVALKLRDRALADGDEILGLLGGFGASADGQGGSVLAPNRMGQKLCVQRARAVNGVDPDEVDWVVGHGTGTKLGDAIELESLAELAGPRGHPVTSNKPLVGHTGWAAGAVSVVHVLLALQQERIPGQRYFNRLPAHIRAGTLTVPKTDIPWPARPGRRRTAAVCAYGLGGSNAHLIIHGPELATHPALRSAPTPRNQEDIVLVGWSAHLPGRPTHNAVLAWLRGEAEDPPRSFGDRYPLPPFEQLRMPPVSAESTDRTQLMALAATASFVERYGELWAGSRERTGVITGHMGPTRAMTEYSVRLAADDLTAALAGQGFQETDQMRRYLELLKDRLPAANSASMPGVLPNMIACRLANRLRLNGIALNVDAGRSSAQAALHVASRYLSTGELNLALVLGINGNATPVMAELTDQQSGILAEGAIMLALTRKKMADERGWTSLAAIRTQATARTTGDTYSGERAGESNYLGADGALAVLRSLHRAQRKSVIRNYDPGPQITVTTFTETQANTWPTRNRRERPRLTGRGQPSPSPSPHRSPMYGNHEKASP